MGETDTLRTLKKKDFKEGDMFDALQELLSIKDTTYGIRNDYINVYYLGDCLMKIESKSKALSIEFNAGHFRYYNDHQGVYCKNDADWEQKWDAEWAKIDKELSEKLQECSAKELIKFNMQVSDYAKEAKNQYLKKQTDKSIKVKLPSWTLTAEIRSKPEAERFVKEICEPVLKPAVMFFVNYHYNSEVSERKYAQKLFKENNCQQFALGNSPSLFYSDCEYRLPENKLDLLKKNPKPLYDDLINWPDEIKNTDNEVVVFGSPDGVGAFIKKDGSIIPCFIEVKQGTGAYGGNSGIRKHLRDMGILANHTMEDRKKEIDFSYSFRCPEKARIEWSKNTRSLLLFILQTTDVIEAKKLLIYELKIVNCKFGNKLESYLDKANVDVEFVFTEKTDGTDFISCYQDLDKRMFSLSSLISLIKPPTYWEE